MPAKKQTAARKRSPAARTTRKSSRRAAKSSIFKSRMAAGALIVLSWILSVITLARLGIFGAFVNEVLQLVCGSFLYVLLPCVCIYGFWYVWNIGRKQLALRQLIGFGFFAAAWMLGAGLLQTPKGDPWQALNILRQAMPDFSTYSFQSAGGILGALFAGSFSSLFSTDGAWLFASGFLLIGVTMMFWKYVRMLLVLPAQKNSRQKSEKRTASLKRSAAKTGKALQSAGSTGLSLLDQLSGRRQAAETATAALNAAAATANLASNVFDNGILADVGLEPYVDPDTLHQQKLPGFEIPQADSGAQNSDGLQIAGKKPAKKTKKAGSASGVLSIDAIPEAAPAPSKSRRSKKAAESLQPSAFDETVSAAGTSLDEPLIPYSPYEMEDPQEAAAHQARIAGRLHAQDAKDEEAASKTSKARSKAQKADEAIISKAAAYDPKTYKLPPLSLLEESGSKGRNNVNLKNARVQGTRLIEILRQFNVDATLGDIHIGPSVTEFEVIPGQGVRVNTFVNLQSDIKMALAAKDIRVEAPIPGKSAVGIEVPNAEKTAVSMKELMKTVPAAISDKPLVFTLGKDLMGTNVYGRLDTMPHLLIAGATGSGKSVCVNSIICSILLRTRPDEVKLLLIDPKKVEFTPYNGIPHLLSPVITDAALASGALKVIVEMMDQRYSLFEELSVRNISSYNDHVSNHPEEGREKLPRIVVIIDELADLMLAASKDVEQSIQRITQLARAAGIHLIVATQRPSVNVITGVIKANIPSRIAFMVSSRPDSRTILDQSGAEKLLGYGDMLFLDNGDSAPTRLQGVFIQDHEVERICSYVKKQAAPAYADPFIMLKDLNESGAGSEVGAPEDVDPLYPEVKEFVIVSRKASTSLIQRRFRLGYGRAARILDQLEASGIIGPANGSRPREILVESGAEDLEGDY